ncbi:hypothetical protein ACOMHN_045170 [Nucella lapillus]
MNPTLPLRLHQLHHRIHEHEQQHQAAGVERKRRRRKVRRTVWVRNWLTEARRRELSHYYNLLQIIHDDDADPWTFKNYTRVTPEIFLEILDRIRPRITKEDTVMRLAIEPGLKLAVALRYMATGDSYGSLAYAFRVGFSTVSMFVPQVCQTIFVEFEHDTFDARWSRDAWLAIAEKFEKRWNMPHVMGALDGKHVAIRKPKGSGSLYHNYKGFFSIPMLALVDADYKFVWVELGGMGHMSDSQIFLQTGLRDALEDGSVLRPDPCPLTDDPEDTTPVPYYIVADDAFALRDFCMKTLLQAQHEHQGADLQLQVVPCQTGSGERLWAACEPLQGASSHHGTGQQEHPDRDQELCCTPQPPSGAGATPGQPHRQGRASNGDLGTRFPEGSSHLGATRTATSKGCQPPWEESQIDLG